MSSRWFTEGSVSKPTGDWRWRIGMFRKLANASMGKNYIETIWGRGYVLREPTEGEAKISA